MHRLQKFIDGAAKFEMWGTLERSRGEPGHIGDWVSVGEGVYPLPRGGLGGPSPELF